MPVVRDDLVARDRECSELMTALGEARVVTVTGPPGVGKTAVVYTVAEDVAASWDEVAVVDLVALDGPDEVERAVARALGVTESVERSLAESMMWTIADRRVLVALDNCEHVAAHVAGMVSALLA